MYLSNTRLTWRTPKIDKSGASKSGDSCHIESTVRPSLLAYCLLLTKTGIRNFILVLFWPVFHRWFFFLGPIKTLGDIQRASSANPVSAYALAHPPLFTVIYNTVMYGHVQTSQDHTGGWTLTWKMLNYYLYLTLADQKSTQITVLTGRSICTNIPWYQGRSSSLEIWR